jgi:hypothetical protein
MRAAIVLCSVFLVAGAQIALAQDPRTIVQTADQSLQQGNMTVFGPQLQLVISQQTGGTGLYQPLTQLGPITNIAIESVQQIPNGLIVQGRAFHQTGYADWTLEFSYLSQKIEFGNFNVYQSGYVIPYAYQYTYQPSWGGRDGWREREWRERRERAFRNEGQPYSQQRQNVRIVPQIAAQPRSLAPVVPPQQSATQPSAAGPQADQNRKLIDQLGFRPSR